MENVYGSSHLAPSSRDVLRHVRRPIGRSSFVLSRFRELKTASSTYTKREEFSANSWTTLEKRKFTRATDSGARFKRWPFDFGNVRSGSAQCAWRSRKA